MTNSSRAGLVAAAYSADGPAALPDHQPITADDEQAWPPSSPKRRAARSQRFRGWGEMANGDVQKHCDCPIGRTQTTNGCVSKRSNSTTSPLFTSTQPFPSIISTASEALPFSMASNQLVKSLMSGASWQCLQDCALSGPACGDHAHSECNTSEIFARRH